MATPIQFFRFRRQVNKTFYEEGRQTFPVANNGIIRANIDCALNESTAIRIAFPDGSSVEGSLYHGRNNRCAYYQFRIVGDSNAIRLQQQINTDSTLEFHFDLIKRLVSISVIR